MTNWPSFRIRVPGKWVLTGEHSVLRGAMAIAMPHLEVGLSLTFEPHAGATGLSIEPMDATEVVQELIARISEISGQRVFDLNGILKISSTIPVGAGLGSSAALCVALTEWLAKPLGIPSDQKCAVATQLEHRFHGKSSGMDVAAISAAEPISFVIGQGSAPVGVSRLPRFTFHDTGLRSQTRDCVAKVQAFQADGSLGKSVDEKMAAATGLALNGLKNYSKGNCDAGLAQIQKAMNLAQECFVAWGLVPDAARALETQLLSQGALAVKLTGAGGGGFCVALWGP